MCRLPPENICIYILTHTPPQHDKAFAVFPYPCIGRFRFLSLYIVENPEYANILRRLGAGGGNEKLLDAGCCFGHVLRQLVADGAPPENLAGLDLDARFIDLGFELFRDRDRAFGAAARFVVGDVLGDGDDATLRQLDGQFGIIHVAAFFHLFGYDEQVRAAVRLVRFFRPDAKDALLVGQQVGRYDPISVEAWREQLARGGEGVKRNYHHNIETFQALWDEVGEKTGTRWRVTGEVTDLGGKGGAQTWPSLLFAVKRVS